MSKIEIEAAKGKLSESLDKVIANTKPTYAGSYDVIGHIVLPDGRMAEIVLDLEVMPDQWKDDEFAFDEGLIDEEGEII